MNSCDEGRTSAVQELEGLRMGAALAVQGLQQVPGGIDLTSYLNRISGAESRDELVGVIEDMGREALATMSRASVAEDRMLIRQRAFIGAPDLGFWERG